MTDIVERLRYVVWLLPAEGVTDDEHALAADALSEIETLRDLVLDLTAQACERDGELDSMAISTYADAIRYLADLGWATIDRQAGRRVIGRWADDVE